MTSLWGGAVEVAAAKLAAWDEDKSTAVAKLRGTPPPFAASDLASTGLDVLDAAARIRIE